MAVVKTINVAITATTEKLEAGLSTSSAAAKRLDAAGAMLDKRMQSLVKQFTHSQVTAEEFGTKVKVLERELDAVAGGFVSVAKAQERANAITAKMATPLDVYNQKTRELDTLRKLGTLTEQQYRNALAATHAEYRAGTKTTTSAAAAIAASNKNVGSLTNSLTVLTAQVPGLSGVSSQLGMIGLVGAPIAAVAAGIGALTLGISSAISEADRVKDISTEIGGDPTELLALEHAARSTGVSIEQLQTGLQRMTTNASAAVSGSKEMQAIFKALKVDARAVTDNTPEAAFSILADAFSAVENPAERARLAVKMFGKGNIELLDTLTLGSKGLAAYREESLTFGNIVTPEAARIADAWEKSWGRVTLALKSGAVALLDTFGPAIEFTLSALEKLSTASVFVGKVLGGDALGAARVAGWEKANVAAMETTATMHSATAAIKTTAAAQAELNKANTAAEQVSKAAAAAESKRWNKVLEDEDKLLSKLRGDLTPKMTPVDTYLSRVKDINDMFDRGKVVLEERNKLLLAAAEIAKRPTEAAKAEMEARHKVTEAVIADRRAVADMAKDSIRALQDKASGVERPTTRKVDNARSEAEAAFRDIQTAASNPVQTAAKVLEARGKWLEKMSSLQRAQSEFTIDRIMHIGDIAKEIQRPPVAALDAGSQAAFAAFRENQQGAKTADLQLAELRKQIKLLERIAKTGIVLAGAGI